MHSFHVLQKLATASEIEALLVGAYGPPEPKPGSDPMAPPDPNPLPDPSPIDVPPPDPRPFPRYEDEPPTEPVAKLN
jgi:hypothetical protein